MNDHNPLVLHFVDITTDGIDIGTYVGELSDDPMTARVWLCWIKLSQAIHHVPEGESLSERIKINPWESEDESIKEAWSDLTHPENLDALREWSVGDNERVKECYRQARKRCEEKFTESKVKSNWCLVGNIVSERPYGEGGVEKRSGTKHFSPKTKVYCMPTNWGDGYDQIIVIGRHRKSKHFKTMIISSSWVENWRAKVVYNPEVLRRIAVLVDSGRATWGTQYEVENYVRMLTGSSSSTDEKYNPWWQFWK